MLDGGIPRARDASFWATFCRPPENGGLGLLAGGNANPGLAALAPGYVLAARLKNGGLVRVEIAGFPRLAMLRPELRSGRPPENGGLARVEIAGFDSATGPSGWPTGWR